MTPLEYVYLASVMLGGGYLALASLLHVIGGGDHGHDADGGGLDADAGDLHVGDLDVDAGDLDIGDLDVGDLDVGDLDVDAGDLHLDGADLDGADVDVGDVDGGHGEHAPAEVEHSGVSFLSPLVLSTLLASFGIMGFIVDHWMAGALVGLAAAIGGAAMGGGGAFWSLNKLSRVEGGSATRVRNLIGHPAEVSVRIPDTGFGEIVYVQNQTRYNAPARVRDGRPIPRGSRVFISGVEGTSFLVEEAKADRIKRLAAAAESPDEDPRGPAAGGRRTGQETGNTGG